MASNTPAFKTALSRVPFTNKAAEALIGEGISGLGKLMSLSSEDIKPLCKVIREVADIEITFMNQKYLDAMRVWVQEKEMFNIDIWAADFNITVAKEYIAKIHRKEDIGKDANRDAAKKPNEFEGKDWNRFQKATDAYLSLLKGIMGIPLIYVIQKEDHPPNINTNYANDRYGELIARAPLSSTTYGKDSHCVFQIIKGLVLKGPAFAWIQLQEAANDGRGAWKSLTAHYDGVNKKTMMKDEAYILIRTSQYMCEKRHFNFEKYLAIHIKAHQDLADNEEPMPKSRKVREFLDHINCNEMEAGVANVLADEGKSENFIATAKLPFILCLQADDSQWDEKQREINWISIPRGQRWKEQRTQTWTRRTEMQKYQWQR